MNELTENLDLIKNAINYIETITEQKIYYTYHEGLQCYKLYTYIVNSKIEFYVELHHGRVIPEDIAHIKRKFVDRIRAKVGKKKQTYDEWVREFAEELEDQARCNGRR